MLSIPFSRILPNYSRFLIFSLPTPLPLSFSVIYLRILLVERSWMVSLRISIQRSIYSLRNRNTNPESCKNGTIEETKKKGNRINQKNEVGANKSASIEQVQIIR